MRSVQSSFNPSSGVANFRRGESAKAARKDDVLELIEKSFDRYDRDDNGVVSWKEMRQNIADPSFQDKNAAALATFYSLINDRANEDGLVRRPSVDSSYIEDLKDDREFALEEGEDDVAAVYYGRYLGKLEKASSELFPDGLPNAFQVVQGYGPSCAFLASTVAQGIIDPSVIKDAITQRKDGKLEVKFPGIAKAQVLAPTTDTETALFSTAGKNGTWLNNLEKAWGAMQKSTAGSAFEHSSWPAASIRAWSGGKAQTLSVPKKLENYSPGEVPEFLASSFKGLASNHIVTTWTRNGQREIDNLIPGHAHTLTGFDPDRGTLELRNPWGKREPLNEQGQPRDGKDDGIFEVTLQEYVKDFGRIALQTSKPKRADSVLESR